MIPSTSRVDTWWAQTYRALEDLHRALLDLIDIGPDDTVPRSRLASDRDREATDRTPGPDGMFFPTPKVQSRRSGTSDPTGRAVAAWETQVQVEVTAAFGLISGLVDTLAHLGLDPVDGQGRSWPPPAEPATDRVNGRVRVVLPPHQCRTHVLAVTGWLAAVADRLADRLYAVTDPQAGEHLWDQAERLRRTVGGMARRVGPEAPVRRCACGCGRQAPPQGEGATRSGCRSRIQREREQQEGAA